jgi:ElaA protein
MSAGAIVAKPWSEFTRDEVFDMAKLRSDVFFLEQRITEEELDHFDRLPETIHYWLADERGFAAYLRVVVDESEAERQRGAAHSIGRVVVRPDRRGEGLAKLLMAQAIADCGSVPMALHAQVYIAKFYRDFGFAEFGEEFDEAGIAHIMMFRPASS